ncbi:MAG: YggS family pyridoxal phosphate-dependent enzyme [Clostridiales bacterium]|nr:YggS family pyridoxal phosphate-dependent enzyme [Clostridiales bacterium]MDD7054820.1 YggS family pyridoxal phosphate-dependent enzyme [Clostridiales bacterium]MDY5189957.1 YggS family pyridoxal phosphate-dependent enzyme [Eubacteriales bacterium]
MVNEDKVIENYKNAMSRLETALEESGRNVQDVLVIGASKTMPLERILFVRDNTDVKIFGENRVQELLEKYTPDVRWHFIGQLQTNKVKYIIDKVELIHSVDRISLLQEIDRQAKKHGKVQDILIEVNIGGEEKKGGVAPAEVIDFAKEVDKYPSVRLKGLMSVLPNVEKEALDAFYLQLSKLYDTLKQTRLDNADIRYLSAGMSNDYDVAVKYGANIVRLGRALFGEREVITNG